MERIGDRCSIQLRLSPPKNHQRASIEWARNYELGAVAQLEVAPAWHAGGRRFESGQLHSPQVGDAEEVGAHEFRNLFGHFMQRAHAGESFLITRRGKPYARLIAAFDQPELIESALRL